MFEEIEKQEDPTSIRHALDPNAIAAGLLRNDIPILLPLLLVLAVSSIAQSLYTSDHLTHVSQMMSLDRLLQLAVMSFVVLRWRRRLEHVRGRHSGAPFAALRIMLVGFVMWAMLTGPLIAATATTVSWLPSLCVFIFAIAVFWSFRFYFYFAIIGLLGGSLRAALRETSGLARKEPMAAVRSLVSPIAVTALMIGILSYPSPDGRSLFWATVTSAAEGIFRVLATYTGLAYSLILIDDSAWRQAGLDPYRKERLRTLEAQGRASHFNWLSPRSGWKIFAVALCVIVGNFVQGFSMAPAARVKVEKVEARNHGLGVVLEVTDPQYKFRGFNPYAFSLASQTGFAISSGIPKVSLGPDGDPLKLPLPSEPGPLRLYVDFPSNKTEEALKKLDNLYLWYNIKALVPLAFEAQKDTKVAPDVKE